MYRQMKVMWINCLFISVLLKHDQREKQKTSFVDIFLPTYCFIVYDL